MVDIVKSVVDHDDDGIRLDRWFHRHHKQYSFAAISKLARTGQLRIDGKRAKSSDRILEGQEIRFPNFITELHPEQSKAHNKHTVSHNYDLTDEIIFMNSQIIVINKPAGLAVQGGNGVEVSVDQLSEELIFDAKEKPRLVHRIDKDTSGILIMARNAKVAQELSENFQNRAIEKRYIAILHGHVMTQKGIINAPLAKYTRGDGFENMQVSANGKEAITEYVVLDRNDKASCVEMNPTTGRKHQIRAHAEHIGHPIIGDKKYNKSVSLYKKAVQNLCLHASEMKVNLFGEKLHFTAPIPEHFYEVASFFELQLKK